MLNAFICLLTAQMLALSGVYLIALWIACHFFQKQTKEGPVIPMTVIKPMRGLDDGLEENLRALIEADRDGVLQALFVMENREDPAYPIAAKVAAQYPGRDVRVVVSGPSGKRMGKVHNMIEGLKEARHPIVIFSDSDVLADRAVLVETSRAFQSGADAACALPDATGRCRLTDALIGLCFNHFFAGTSPLIYRLGMCPFAGGWMAFRRDFLQKLGGLERFAQSAAEDASLALAVYKTGARAVLLPRLVRIREHGGTLLELVHHLLKWMKVVRFTLPWLYLLIPFGSAVFVAAMLCATTACLGRSMTAPGVLLVVTACFRIVSAWIQDRFTAAAFFPAWAYLLLPAADLIFVFFWICAFFSRTLVWRGKKYRLYHGGRVEALPGKNAVENDLISTPRGGKR